MAGVTLFFVIMGVALEHKEGLNLEDECAEGEDVKQQVTQMDNAMEALVSQSEYVEL